MTAVVESLGKVPLFTGFGRRDLERLAKNMDERSFEAGSAIVEEGKGGVAFFVIEEGEAVVTVGDQEVRRLGPGDHFGEIALIDNGPRSASVEAAGPLRCRCMTAWQFRPLVQSHPEMAWTMLEVLARRVRDAQQRGQAG